MAASLSIAPLAIQETPVPVSSEPHHHLKISTDDARAYYVAVDAHSSTLLHSHDLDYFYVMLSISPNLTNRVVGKPDQPLSLTNGDIRYARGGFAHALSNDGDTPFRNITVILLKPQGEPRNLCAKVIQDQPLKCDAPAASDGKTDESVPQFATDQLVINLERIAAGHTLALSQKTYRRILIPLDGSNLIYRSPSGKVIPLDGGHVEDVSPGSEATLKNIDKDPARVYVAEFRSGSPAK
jgi:hypothetical protein